MSKGKISENKKTNNESVTSIVAEDKGKISEAVEKAEKNIDSVAYSDNLVKPSKNSKGIRSLNLKETKNKTEKNSKSNNSNLDNNNTKSANTNDTKDQSNDNLLPINNEKLKNEKKKTTVKTAVILSCIALLIISLILLFSVIFALIVNNQSTIINGVKIKDIDVSGLTREEAYEKLSGSFNTKLSQSIVLRHNNYELTVFPEQFSISFNINNAVDTAFEKGRTGNIFQNNFEILSALFFNININPGFSYNEDSFSSLATEMETNFEDRFIESNYYIEDNNLAIYKGKNGVSIDSKALKENIIYFIYNLDVNNGTINIPVVEKTATPLDINRIHEEIYKAPENAYYTTDPYVVHPQVDGIDFAISMEEATAIFNDAQDECAIPLQVLEPAVTTNQIGEEAFPDLLGEFSTNFSTSNYNRSTNIRLATSKINGTVIMPGEVFSYNQTVGKRTTAAGFREAAVYSGGEVTTGIGGGICQVSSTLYNAALYANLDIIERQNHGFNTGYVAAGRDATVSWGGPDFKFQNNRDYPVKLVCSVSGGTILTQIFGLLMENEPEVVIESYVTQSIGYRTITQYDDSLPTGATRVIQSGSNGCRAVCYRILKLDGEVISKTLMSSDTYNPHNKIVAVGT